MVTGSIVGSSIVYFVGVTFWNLPLIACHLTGCGKKTQIMQKFSGGKCGKLCQLCGKHTGLCANFSDYQN